MEHEEPYEAHELKEKLEQAGEAGTSWSKYLALTTVFIAVFAAIASLFSGSYSNQALIEKNDAILYQNKASDQWSYYQAKGIKKNIAEVFAQSQGSAKLKKEALRYGSEQEDIKKVAVEYEKKRDESNITSEFLLAKHHKLSFAVTLFQIAISLAAMSALLRRRIFWILAMVITAGGAWFFVLGFF